MSLERRGFARETESEVVADLREIVEQAPFRHMVTPGGHQMSVAMTNCGCSGWVTDRSGYRYDANDPVSAKPWPQMPPSFRALAGRAISVIERSPRYRLVEEARMGEDRMVRYERTS